MSNARMGSNNHLTSIENKYFVQDLYDTTCLSKKFSLLEKEIQKSGFDGALYTFIPKLSRLSNSLEPVFQHSESYDEVMINYKKNNYSRDDFVIRLVEEGKTDIIDWWELAEKIELTKKEKHVNKVAKEQYGITKGISFPTLSNDLGFAGVSMISFKESFSNKTIDTKILDHLGKCSRQYHDHALIHQDSRYKFILPILKTLTTKKIILIKYLISGKPMKYISDHEEISTRYAEKLLIELRKQFGNITTNELIYLLGLLNISEHL